MHRIESPGATQDNRWTEGDPASGTPATQISAKWMNAVQDEIVKVILAAGLTLKTSETESGDQLLAALQAMGLGGYATAAEAQGLASLTKLLSPGRLADAFMGGNQALTGKGYQKLPGGLMLQWANWYKPAGSSAAINVPWSIAFPNEVFGVWSSARNNVFPLSHDPVDLASVTVGLGGYWSNTANQGSGFVYGIGR